MWKFQEIYRFSFQDNWGQSFHHAPYMVVLVYFLYINKEIPKILYFIFLCLYIRNFALSVKRNRATLCMSWDNKEK